ncbi:MAG TPA: L-glutamate gamma-semialdehyde dehydrogenase [Candidatus Poseidoniales archaeon]|jgi:1-pyrroline-5-carboxylate dehydrogenase|nr:MAG: 1-pyrroline-5-carboxylate dehydrogenase [Euryarchaeota archaeon]HIG03044.1 L-glutamate gamma-semialdehyde dehydrogenase [Candidatus Poseidoniales archaeon]HIK79269.1 L-glutamate gamma-semialdehyde dehydrogenase [Candidatus Poseidoniales archaeon]
MSHPVNEPILEFLPGSIERKELQEELDRQSAEVIEIPCIINGEKIFTGNTVIQVMPHNHSHVLANVHLAGEAEVKAACASAVAAQEEWINIGLEARAAIFEKAANLLAGEWRKVLNAATMLNQSKTAYQAEIDAACELIDFWRFNAYYSRNFHDEYQPLVSPTGVENSTEIRPLEGFVFAVTPFNFTSIAGNLPTAPALLGNTAIWKPSRNSIFSNWKLMELLIEAGLPAGVINFIPGKASMVSSIVMADPDFAGVHFTGSTKVFQGIWSDVAAALPKIRSYPRIVGETGGKDFIVAHSDCDRQGLLVALLRGAFEFQGQKCSAASRAYVPTSVWNAIKDDYVTEVGKITMGDPRDFTNFMTAVIDEKSFANITGYIDRAHKSPSCEIITGGGYDGSKGWFIEPTTIVTTDAKYESMCEEIFGPVMSIYIYQDEDFDATLKLCDESSPYALTGSIFSSSEENIQTAFDALRFAAGNFYINDKPTGAVVAQQPFGGARASGTNDKAGSPLNLLRWISPRSVKRTLDTPQDWRYGFLQPDE